MKECNIYISGLLYCTDINEFYTYTLESSKPVESKTAETCKLAERWEGSSPPVPAGAVNIAKKVLENEVR